MIIFPYFYLALLFFSLLFTTCSIASPILNEPLVKSSAIKVKSTGNRSEDLTLILTFSGGGTRAAALSYGVLDELRNTSITINNKKRRLLEEKQ